MCYQSSNGRGGALHTQAKFSLCSILGQRLTLHETIYRNKKTELVLIIHGILRHRYSQNKNAPALIHCAVVLVTWWRAGPARGAVDVVPWCRGAVVPCVPAHRSAVPLVTSGCDPYTGTREALAHNDHCINAIELIFNVVKGFDFKDTANFSCTIY